VYPRGCGADFYISQPQSLLVELSGWIIFCLHRETRHKKPLWATEQYRYGRGRILGFCLQVAGTLLLPWQINDRQVQWHLITKTAWQFSQNS
jgi:hypothetical protein